ncbi:molybdopterin-dependent oxidoreductase [Pseudoflavonifractor sp. DSM 107456]|uniref:Molybdopterin-dependent oxidoreductase n=2 Tax=Pseudoflavonifractor TaxID=1017280 RepID=A0ABR9R909_9FIRM|nr:MULTISPECIES: molybdopterin cofactor-binding domain-containing protein [Pseudoflavonifractor]MBC5731833.1 molybdopterin-dependent oxidoreductase [Pseudoflavonifractor hominis]MBE5055182.1 molybdopterin-dependent oxidoreductase [Pseudoflavonifractor gallinarum]
MKYIGQPTPTIDAVAKVTGEAVYTDDLRFPGMLWGKVLTSPVAHARIRSIDTSKAEALPGVRAVITYQDSPKTCFNRIMRWAKDGIPATERVLDDVVRFVGDEVAAVAADTEAIAQKAIKLIEVDYEELPAVFDPEEALKEDAPHIYPEGNLLKAQRAECGDVDAALAEADVVVENALSTQMIHHGAIEPHQCIARWNRGDYLEVWEPQQGVHRVQIMLGQIFGLPYTKIAIHGGLIGGTFGGKDGVLLEPIALLLSKKAGGKVVKIRYNRTESMVSTYTRHAIKLYGKMAVQKDGTMTGFEIRSFMNSGPYCGGSINVQAAMCGKMFKVYQAPNQRFDGKAAYTNTPVGGAMRGFGSPKVFTTLELLVNKAAKAVHMDPVDFRERNLVRPYGLDRGANDTLGNARVHDCLVKGAELFRWKEKLAGKAAKETDRYVYGYGVATALHGNGVAPFAPDITVAELMVHEDGSVLLRTGLTDHGAGTYTLMKQIVAETLDIPFDQIELTHSDTHSCPYDMGSGASRNTWSGGAAVETVSRQMEQTLRAVAADALGCPVEQVQHSDGAYWTEGSDTRLTRADLACYAYDHQKRKLLETVSYCSDHNAGSYGAHFAEVRVDKQTGEVKVTDYLAVCDVGTALNPMLLEGQIEGAVLMGMGMALFEGLQLDEKGRPINANLKKYRLPRSTDLPPISIHFVEEFEQGGPYGGKSIGEASIVPVVPAIVGAVNDALNADLHVLPLTPDRVKAAMEGRS